MYNDINLVYDSLEILYKSPFISIYLFIKQNFKYQTS